MSARLGFDASQVVYEGFDAGEALASPQAIFQQDTTSITIGVSSLAGTATVNAGLVGTVRFRTTAAFSDTEVWLVDAELTRDGQTVTISPAEAVALQVAAPPSRDFDGNGLVGFSDFVAFAGVFGARQGDSKYVAAFDLNSDGGIGFDDFVIFAASFGEEANRSPVFTTTPPVTRSVEENTVAGEAIGDPVSATDADGDSLTYRLRGVHADSFTIASDTGQLLTKEGIAYDHEARDTYSVTVRATDGEGGRATIVVGIAVTDVDEPPSAAPDSVVVAPRDTALWRDPPPSPRRPVTRTETARRRLSALSSQTHHLLPVQAARVVPWGPSGRSSRHLRPRHHQFQSPAGVRRGPQRHAGGDGEHDRDNRPGRPGQCIRSGEHHGDVQPHSRRRGEL